MTRLTRAVRLGAVALALSAFAFAAAPAHAERTLRVTLQLPLKSHLGQNLVLFKEEVERLSNGEINVEIYDSAQLFRDKEVPEAVSSGQIDMGVASLTQYAGEIPAVDVFYLPFVLNTEEKVRAAVAADSPVRQAIDEAILETGSKVLWWQAYGGTILLSKGEPIATPEDIANKKVRVFGKTLGQWVEVVGGVPTIISGSEQFLAYQRGTVDVGMTGISGVQSRSMWEVMDTVTKMNLADIEFLVIINADLWASLSPQEQMWINTAAATAQDSLRNRMSAIEEEGYAAARENGMTIYELTPEEEEAWRAASQPLIDMWLEESGDLGRQVYEAASKL